MADIDKVIRTDLIWTRVEYFLLILVITPIPYVSIQENRYVVGTNLFYFAFIYFGACFNLRKIEITDKEIKYRYYARVVKRSGSIPFLDIKKIGTGFLFTANTIGIKYRKGDKTNEFYLRGGRKRFRWLKEYIITRNPKITFDDDCAILD